MELLEQINTDLLQVIGIAENDFHQINGLLKGQHEGEGIFGVQAASLISELQYMDTFKQRIQHLIMVHRYVNDHPVTLNFKESFFHLHAFQSMTIQTDLIRSTESIKTSVQRMAFSHHQESRFLDKNVFQNIPEIKGVLQKTMDALSTAGGDIRFLPVPPFTSEQVHMLNNVYTMESERAVLRWFLHAMTSRTRDSLFQYYQYAVHTDIIKDAELF